VTEPVHPPADTWESILEAMRRRYPGQRDGVLFCIHKLQQDPDLTLRDFRAEASLHGIPVGGRSLHSARTLLGLARAPVPPEPPPPVEPHASGRQTRTRRRAPMTPAASIEDKVLDAVRQIQTAAGADANHLRAAIREAVAILQRALDD
jgi:hypothetical protein